MRLAEALLRVPTLTRWPCCCRISSSKPTSASTPAIQTMPPHPLLEGFRARLLHLASQIMQGRPEPVPAASGANEPWCQPPCTPLQTLGQQFVLG